MELLGISEVAELARVSRQAVVNWRSRKIDLPKPIAELRSGPVWAREDIENWLKVKRGMEFVTKVISFINLKGGVCKTTSTVAIAEFLALENNKKVLVVDLDPQTNATVALITEDEWQGRDSQGLTLKQLFKDKLKGTNLFDISKAIINGVSNIGNGIPNLSLLPSSLGLIDLQDELALIPGGSFFSISPVDILQNALRPIINEYDYVLIDCPPNLGIITLNGIKISSAYIIPVIADILSTYGIPQIINRLQAFSVASGIAVPPIGIIVSKYRLQSRVHPHRLDFLKGKAAFGEIPPIFETVVPESGQIAEAADVTAEVSTLRQKYGYGKNYEVYSALTKEFIQKC